MAPSGTRAVSLVLTMLALAGCAAPTEGPEGPASPSPSATSVELAKCALVEVIVRVSEAEAKAALPPGFSLAPPSAGGPDGVLGAASCATGGARGFFALGVLVSQELDASHVDGHFWLAEHHVVDGDAFEEAVASVRGDAERGRVAARAGAASAGLLIEAANWSHSAEAAPGNVRDSVSSLFGAVFREWFPAEGGYAYLEASFEGADASALVPAATTLGASSPARAIAGDARAGTAIVVEGVRYANATVGFVPWP